VNEFKKKNAIRSGGEMNGNSKDSPLPNSKSKNTGKNQ
jgi:hypothetical protein